MSKGKHGTKSLSKLDESVVRYIREKRKVTLKEVNSVFGLSKTQSSWVVRKLKDQASGKVAFSREGKHTVAWELGQFQASSAPIYNRVQQQARESSPWPMNARERSVCILNNRLNELWSAA